MYTIPSPRANRELRESLERIQPDVVHASLTLSPLDFGLPELCQQLRVPLVATFHPPFDASLRNITAGGQQLTYQLYAPSLARYNKVIVFSDLQAEVLNRLGVPEDRLAVIPNGVDPRHWHPGSSELQQRFDGRRSLRLALANGLALAAIDDKRDDTWFFNWNLCNISVCCSPTNWSYE